MKRFLQLALLSLAVVVPACTRGCTPEPGKPGVIDCTIQAVKDHAIGLVPKVNSCLVSALAGDVTSCLISLISPAAGITEDVVACVVRSSGSNFAASAQINSNDEVSTRGANNARAFIEERGYIFK